ncbi:MAG: sigma 54-interacting transcriptional regulator [bacterium]|jgi:DNA-binding NtrC family response regulator
MSRILVIDDDPGNRLVVNSRLSDLGYEVRLTESGAEGLVEARELHHDLCLVAAGLVAGVDATEVCRRLKGMPETGAIPVVLYSQLPANPEELERAFEAGCDAFVPKQELSALDHIIRVHLRHRALIEDLTDQNRVLDKHNRTLSEESHQASDRQAAASSSGEATLALRELASNRPDGVLLVDSEGHVRHADRGACEVFGSRIEGKTLGCLAPATGLEAFVRDARTEALDGFRFDIPALGGRSARSLKASVVPLISKPGEPGPAFKVVLMLDAGKRRIAGELLRISEPGIPRQQMGSLLDAARETFSLHCLVGESSSVKRTRTLVGDFARRRLPILITGESGVGKSRAARTMHYSGPFSGAFLMLRCSALDPEHLARELFGYVKGAFDGAQDNRPGLVQQAADGTLYLEEVSALPPEIQASLCELIETGVVRRVGSDRAEQINLGLVASTSADLQACEFSRNLLGLFKEGHVHLPALVSRQEDILPLASLYVTRYGRGHGVRGISGEAVDLLMSYEWPGNVHEFEECIRTSCSRATDGEITPASLPDALLDGSSGLPTCELTPVARHTGPGGEPVAGGVPVPNTAAASMRRRQPWDICEEDPISLELYEKKALMRALNHVGGDKLAAARLLKVGKSTLYRKLKRFDIA